MSEIKLLPCPFCGGEARVVKTHGGEFAIVHENDECPIADAEIYQGNWLYDTQIEAIEFWNTRKPMQEIVERLEPYMVDIRNTNQLFNGSCAFHTAIKIVKEVGGMNDNTTNSSSNAKN